MSLETSKNTTGSNESGPKKESQEFAQEVLDKLNEDGQEVLKNINKKFEQLDAELISGVETVVTEALDGAEVPPSFYQKLTDGIKETFAKGNRKKLVAGLFFTILSQVPSFGANSENSSDNDLFNSDNIDVSVANATEDLSDAAKPFESDGSNEGENKLTENTENNPESSLEDGAKVHKLESKADFDLAKTDLEAADIEKLDAEVERFVEGFSADELEKIKSGHMILQIEAGSSEEPIKAPIETSMGEISNNYELSQARAEIFKTKVRYVT